jgi:hypothetical protein
MKAQGKWIAGLWLSFILVAPSSFAGNQTGKVKEIHVRNDNLHWVILEGTHASKPACAGANYWMIENESSAGGKGQLAVLLAAQAQGKPVSISGTNTCSRWGDGESIGELVIVQ